MFEFWTKASSNEKILYGVLLLIILFAIYLVAAAFTHIWPFSVGVALTHEWPFKMHAVDDMQLVMPPAGSGKAQEPMQYKPIASVDDCIKAANKDKAELAVLNGTVCTAWRDSKGFTLKPGTTPGSTVISRYGFKPPMAKA